MSIDPDSLPFGFSDLGDREKSLYLATLICSIIFAVSVFIFFGSLLFWIIGGFLRRKVQQVHKGVKKRFKKPPSRVTVVKMGSFLVDDDDETQSYYEDGDELLLVDSEGKELLSSDDEELTSRKKLGHRIEMKPSGTSVTLEGRQHGDSRETDNHVYCPSDDDLSSSLAGVDLHNVTTEMEEYAEMVSVERSLRSMSWPDRLLWALVHGSFATACLAVVGVLLSFVMFDFLNVYLAIVLSCAFIAVHWWLGYPPSIMHVFNPMRATNVRVERSVMQQFIHQLNRQNGPLKNRLRWLWKRQLLYKLLRKGRPKGLRRDNVRKFVVFWVGLLCLCCVVAAAFAASWGTCFCTHPSMVSTRLMRAFTRDMCTGKEAPCHVYLTMTNDTARQMIINFHTADNDGPPFVFFDNVSRANDTTMGHYRFKQRGERQYLDFLSADVNRYVNYVQMDNLVPNSTYYFRAGLGEFGRDMKRFTEEYSFRTLPAPTNGADGGRVHFAAGGDMGVSEDAVKFWKMAGQLDVDFMLIGGDLAYASASPSCYRRWDNWLRQWRDNMRGPRGNLIPVIAALGNHEGQELAPAGFLSSYTPYFSSYFPQRANIPSHWSRRKTYSGHRLSSHSFLTVLDSGHGVSAADPNQLRFLEDSLKTHASLPFRFATYHVPLYPSGRQQDNPQSSSVRKAWLPFFDKYNLTMAFENHDHTYKRTYPLRNNTIVPSVEQGTVYIGDGCMGVSPRSSHSRWYTETAVAKEYMLHVDVTHARVNVTTHGLDGTVFDHVVVHNRDADKTKTAP